VASSFDNPAGSWLKVALLSYADPFAKSSLYYGGGIGWGTTQANIDDVPFSNFGVDVALTAGIEMHRTSALRYFVQLDAGSEWSAWVTPYVHLAAGNVAEARASAKNMAKAPSYHRELMAACVAPQRPSDFDKTVRDTNFTCVHAGPKEGWGLCCTQTIDIVKTRLVKNYGYCDVCATDVLNFVASIFARGDAKES